MLTMNDLGIFVGTYSRPILFGSGKKLAGKGEGIYLLRFETQSGKLRHEKTFSNIDNPSFLCISNDGKNIWAVNELKEFENEAAGSVSSFIFDKENLTLHLMSRLSTGSTDPCHIVSNSNHSHVFVSNYSGGSIAVYKTNIDGTIERTQFFQHVGSSINLSRQASPHAHSMFFDKDEKFIFVADLGMDTIVRYQWNGRLMRPSNTGDLKVHPGGGPRHCLFNDSGEFCYIVNELTCEISMASYDASTGTMEIHQTLLATEGHHADNSAADVHITPDGRFLYVSNKSADALAIFRVDGYTGLLEMVDIQSSYGKTPRNFMIVPDGRFLICANQNTDNIVVFSINKDNGKLSEVSEIGIPTPVCLKPLP